MRKKTITLLSAKMIFFLLGIIYCSNLLAEEIEKSVYIPTSFANPNNESSQWCYARSKQSANFVVFWEAGYGKDPQTVSSSAYRVDVDAILKIAENCFAFYTDSLKFIQRGASKTDKYKMIIRLYYSTTWLATGLGEDDVIGELNLSANAAQALGTTVAHEVGHCFQYQVYADQGIGGWRYGLGDNGAGGNGFWEQCAQWQAFKIFPNEQFSNYRFGEYLGAAHKHILHETPRYANYFIQDYWCYLHGMDFLGRLWRESKYPEDPIEAYKRITGIKQADFNNEIYDCATRFVTWDIPALRSRGETYIDSRAQTLMNLTEDGYWLIDPTKCLENYGYNVIKLNAPAQATTISVCFEGQTTHPDFRSQKRTYGAWRYGFVALLKDGTRVYSDMHSSLVSAATMTDPKDTVTFDCPSNCSKLWMVVTGAPKVHWHHQWDDDDSNDEQWPYRVKFTNTNLYGTYEFAPDAVPHDTIITCNVTLAPVTSNTQPYPSTAVQPDINALCYAFCMNLTDLQKAIGNQITYAAVNPNGSLNTTSTANAPGHWFNNNGTVTNWGNNSYIFSELNTSTLTFNIGQYPQKCKDGDNYTIRQALVYKTAAGKSVRATIVFNIAIRKVTAIEETVKEQSTMPILLSFVNNELRLTDVYPNVTVRDIAGRVVRQLTNTDCVSMKDFPSGIYLVTVNNKTIKVSKQ